MPRAARRENLRHPLKLLRSILSDDSDQPITQQDLAQRIGSTTASIKVLEGGKQRLLGESLSARIKDTTGAEWDEEKKMWVFAYPPKEAKDFIPFTHELYAEYRRYLETPPRDKAAVAKWTARKLEMLLLMVDDARRYALLFQIERALARWADEFQINGTIPEIPGDKEWNDVRAVAPETEVAEYLRETRTSFVIGFDRDTGKLVQFAEVPGAIVPTLAERGHAVMDPGAEKPARPRRRKAKA